MTRGRWTLAIVLGLLAPLVLPTPASSHVPHVCPDGFPDAPTFPDHFSQQDVVDGKYSFDEIFERGRLLFTAAVNLCDGQGRPATTGGGAFRDPLVAQPTFIRTSAPDSSACAGCHAQPRAGGGGDFVANVFVLAQTLDPVTESVNPEFSNERNTLGMFGGGAIEMLAREITADLHAIRDAAISEARAGGSPVRKSLDSKGINFGAITANADGSLDTSEVKGVDPDLTIKPFHQAGAVHSLREFTVNAFNHHHGLQAEERFDLNPEKGADFDQDGMRNELTIGDITAATIFQAALGVPGRLMPADDRARTEVERGEVVFGEVGCATCHVPELRLDSRMFTEPYELNPAGTFSDAALVFGFDMTEEGEGPYLEKADDDGAILRAFTDLKRHNLCDPEGAPDAIRYYCNEQLAQGRPDQDGRPGAEFFLTRKLWDVGNSAPYGHRGDLTTITEAILVHGGEARAVRDAFTGLPAADQQAVVAFLKTLQVLPAGADRVMTVGETVGGGDDGGIDPALIGAILVVAAVALGFGYAAMRARRRQQPAG